MLPENLKRPENSSHIIGALYDSKSELILTPNLFRSGGDFIRAIQGEAKNPQSMLNKFAADYDLVIVGEWDEKIGITKVEHRRLGSVLDLCPLS